MKVHPTFKRIALVKTGWSDEYQGEPVVGRHAHIAQFDDAHEKYNFKRVIDGSFYGYLPPMGRARRPPQPKRSDDWLLIFVSARNGKGPLTVVGWYKNAELHPEYLERPEYDIEADFNTDVHGDKYRYCISADLATLVPVGSRTETISSAHFKRTPILYLRGNGKSMRWREELAKSMERLVTSWSFDVNEPPPHVSFPDPEHRKKIELAAVEAAKKFLKKEYVVTDRQKDNCGYDLLARHRKSNEELHIEVKGTSNERMHFYMTRGEHRYMTAMPQWRLIMVTNTLQKPNLKLLTREEVKKMFDFAAFAWEASAK